MANKRDSVQATKSIMEKMGQVGKIDRRKVAAGEEEVSLGAKPDSYFTDGEVIDTDDGAPMTTGAPSVIPTARPGSVDEDVGIFELPSPVETETVSVEKPLHQKSSAPGKEVMKNFLMVGQQLARSRQGEKAVYPVIEGKIDEGEPDTGGLSIRERRMALLKKIVPKGNIITESSPKPSKENNWKSLIDKAVSNIGVESG